MRFLLSFLLSFLSVTAFAQSFGTSHLPFSDAPQDRPTAVAVSFLAEQGILKGYSDQTFRPNNPVNRAEFMKVAALSRPSAIPAATDLSDGSLDCFPDVRHADWFAPAVCAAKTVSIVKGNPDGTFRPGSSVNYAEAVKILDALYDIPQIPQQNGAWYAPYIAGAASKNIDLPGMDPTHALTRGEVARLVAAYLAWSEGDLVALRAAQSTIERVMSSASSVPSTVSHIPSPSFASSVAELPSPETSTIIFTSHSPANAAPYPVGPSTYICSGINKCSKLPSCPYFFCVDGSSFPSCNQDFSRIFYATDPCDRHQGQIVPLINSTSSVPSASIVSTGTVDPDTNRALRSTFVPLGSVSPVLAWATIKSPQENINVRHITVTLSSRMRALKSLLLYSENGQLISDVSVPNSEGTQYLFTFDAGDLIIPFRGSLRFYVRAAVQDFSQVKMSGEIFQVLHIDYDAMGAHSLQRFTGSALETAEKNSTCVTARSEFTNIVRDGPASSPLVFGKGSTLGSFVFRGHLYDSAANLRMTDITFALGLTGAIGMKNPKIGVRGSGQTSVCYETGKTILCPSLPESIGLIDGGERTLDLTADTVLPAEVSHGNIQLSLIPGTTITPGGITWTDGFSTFHWTANDRVDGTSYGW